MSIYTQVKEAIEALVPATWKFTGYEKPEGSPLPDVTELELKIRAVQRLPQAPKSQYQITWVLTVTSGVPSRQSADPGLADDLIAFLNDLDTSPALTWLGWASATKTVGADLDRLAYDIDLITLTNKES